MASPPFTVKALFEYTSEHPDDLVFKPGQIITVTVVEDEEWYSGKYTEAGIEKVGMFPQNFVELYTPPAPARPAGRPKRESVLLEPRRESFDSNPDSFHDAKEDVIESSIDVAKESPVQSNEPVAEPIRLSSISMPRSSNNDESDEEDDDDEEWDTPRGMPARAATMDPTSPKPLSKTSTFDHSLNSPVATEHAPKLNKAPFLEEANQPAPSVSHAPKVKSSSFRDRIAAFNNPAAEVAPKPAPPAPKPKKFEIGATSSYVPPIPSNQLHPSVEAARYNARSEERKPAEAVSETSPPQQQKETFGDSSSDDEAHREHDLEYEPDQHEHEPEAPGVSLKDRIRLLQQKQAEEQARAEAAAAAKKERKSRKEQHTKESPAVKPQTTGGSLERVVTGESLHSLEKPVSRRQSLDRRDSMHRRRDSAIEESGRPLSMHSLHDDVPEGVEEDDDEYESDNDKQPSALPGIPAMMGAPAPLMMGAPAPAFHAADDDEDEDEDEDSDDEEARRIALRERMAKLSGGGLLGMGMMGGPAVPFAFPGQAIPQTQEKQREAKAVKAEEDDEAPMEVPASAVHPEPVDDDIPASPVSAPVPPSDSPDSPSSLPCDPIEVNSESSEDDETEVESRAALPSTAPVAQDDSAEHPVPVVSVPASPPPVPSSRERESSDSFRMGSLGKSLPNTNTGDETGMGDDEHTESDASSIYPQPRRQDSTKRGPSALGGAPVLPLPAVQKPISLDGVVSGQYSSDEVGGYDADEDTDLNTNLSEEEEVRGIHHVPTHSERAPPPPVPISPVTSAPPPPPIPSSPSASRGIPPPIPQSPERTVPSSPIGRTASPPPIPQSPILAPPMPFQNAPAAPAPPIPHGVPPPPPPNAHGVHPHSRPPPPPIPSLSQPGPQHPPPPPQAPPGVHIPPPGPAPPAPPSTAPVPPPHVTPPVPSLSRSFSTRRNRASLDLQESYMARDLDLGEESQWWLEQRGIPASLLQRVRSGEAIYEMEDNETHKRGGRTQLSRDIYIVYSDYSQTTISAQWAPEGGINLEQSSTPPPPNWPQPKLEEAHRRFGRKMVDLAHRQFGQLVSDGSLAPQCVASLKDAMPSIGGRAFGALVYTNMGNATTQQFDEIRAGDVVVFRNASFAVKGGLGMKTSVVEVGASVPHAAVVYEWDGTKRKLRVFEQHEKDLGTGSAKVKQESYRLADLKSGEVKVYRVVGREYVGWDN